MAIDNRNFFYSIIELIFFQRISHDYSDQSTLEDSKMMAFFDSLIQREIEGIEMLLV